RLDDTIIGCNAEAAALLDLPAGRVGGSLRNLAIDRVAGLLSALTEIKDRLRPDDARQTGLRVDLGWAVVMLRPVLSDRGEVQAILISFAASAGTVAGGEAQVDGRTSTGSSGRSTSTPDGFAVAAAELSM